MRALWIQKRLARFSRLGELAADQSTELPYSVLESLRNITYTIEDHIYIKPLN